MEIKNQIAESSRKFIKAVGIFIACLLIIFEGLICGTYLNGDANADVWMIVALLVCFVALDVLCFVELYAIKTLKSRIVVYVFDFVILISVCALTGNMYIVALYCIILSQLYLNVEELKTKAIVFVTSLVLFVVTCVVGWFLNHLRPMTYAEIIDIISGCVTGIIIMFSHFLVANFLIGFYRTNKKLTAALKESDDRKAQLEAAFEQLSETAVFEERNRIARDIHDNAGHSMTSVIMQTEAAKLLIDTDPEQAKAKIISANIQAKNALEQMRESVHLLAGRNASRTLKEEAEEIIAQTIDGTDLKIRYDIADVSLPQEIKRFMSNCLKECLSNGIRHGRATAFYVEIAGQGEEVSLTVSDNGSGLAEGYKEGFGLSGIREKAAALGGGITLESESGEGCEIKITVKALDKKEQKND